MKAMKKLSLRALSLLLTLMLVLSMAPISVFATETDSTTNVSDPVDDTTSSNTDEEATGDVVEVSTVDALREALANVQDGDTIKLTGDIVLNRDNAVVSGEWYDGIVYTGDKSFTLDLDGYKISDDGSLNDYLLYFKNLGEKENEITIVNGTIAGGSNLWNVICVGTPASRPTTLNLGEGLTVTGDGSGNGGEDGVVKVRYGSALNVLDGAVVASEAAMYCVQAATSNAIVNVLDGAEINMNNVDGIAVSGTGIVNITGGTVNAVEGAYAVYTSTSGAPKFTISGGAINGDVASAADVNSYPNANPSVEVTGDAVINGDVTAIAFGTTTDENGAEVVISGGTVNGDVVAVAGNSVAISDGVISGEVKGTSDDVVITGGMFGVLPDDDMIAVGSTIVYDGNVITKTEDGVSSTVVSGTLALNGVTYTNGSSLNFGVTDMKASESVVVKLYSGSTLLATTTLLKKNFTIMSVLNVTMDVTAEPGSTWATVWESDLLTADVIPDKAVLEIDGYATSVVALDLADWADVEGVFVAALEDNDGNLVGYESFLEAVAAQNSNTKAIVVYTDITEDFGESAGYPLVYGNVVSGNENGVTITNAVDDYIYMEDLTVNKGVTFVSGGIFFQGGDNYVEGVVEVSGSTNGVYYQGYNAKVTVQNGGRIHVEGTTILRYNTEADAGLYIYGDGDNRTVEFFCSYYIGAYSGTLYAENANVEAGYFLLKNSYDAEKGDEYAGIDLVLDNSDLTTIGTSDGQKQFIANGDASITLKNESSLVVSGDLTADESVDVSIDNTCVLEAANAENGILGEGTAESPYLIYNVTAFKQFRDNVNAGNSYAGKYVKLMVDIDLNNEPWTPIGTSTNTFNGYFDGNNKTISNLYINWSKNWVSGGPNENYVGLFGYMKGGNTAAIKNITVENAYVTGCLYVGVILGRSYTGGIIENCHVTGSVFVDGYSYIGGIVGRHDYSKGANVNGDVMAIYNCSVTATTETSGMIHADYAVSYVGGIVGFMGEGNYVIDACSVTNVEVSGVYGIGGISGIAHYGNTISDATVDTVTVTSTGNDPADDRTNNVGLIAGATQGAGSSPSVITGVTVTNTSGSVTYTDETTSEITELYGSNIDGEEPVTNWVVELNGVKYESAAKAFEAAVDGDVIYVLADATLESAVVINGITLTIKGDHALNLNGMLTLKGTAALISENVSGTIYAASGATVTVVASSVALVSNGDITFAGKNVLQSFGVGDYYTFVELGKGASLEIVGDGRMTLGYGTAFIIEGDITDAKTADKSTLTPSLKVDAGISITGGMGASFYVTNAYIVAGKTNSVTSKAGVANGTFTLNFTNSIVDMGKVFGLYAPTADGLNPVFNLTLKDSVLDVATNLVLSAPCCNTTIDNTIVHVGSALRNEGAMTIKNGSVVTVDAMIQYTSGNAGNGGTITVDNAKLVVECSTTGHAMDGNGTGALIVKNGAVVDIDYVTNTAVSVYADGSVLTATQLLGTTSVKLYVDEIPTLGTVIDLSSDVKTEAEVVGTMNEVYGVACADDGDVSVFRYAACVDGTYYATLEEAVANADGKTVVLVDNVTLADKLTIANGTSVTIDLAGYTVTYEKDTIGEAMITVNGELIVNDTVGGGAIVYNYTGANDANYGKGNYLINNNGKVTVNGGTLEIKAGDTVGKFSHALYTVQNYQGSSFTLNDGKILNYNNIAVRAFVSSDSVTNLTVNGGEIVGLRAIWLQLASGDASKAPTINLTVTGGTLTGTAIDGTADSGNVLAIYSYSYGNNMQNVNVNISGGTFNGDIALTGGANKNDIEKVTITGGTFNGLYGEIYSYGDDTKAAATITIKGGTFATNGAEIYCMDDGFMFTENADGTYGVEVNPAFGMVALVNGTYYATVTEAINAAGDGDTIYLLAGTIDEYVAPWATDSKHTSEKSITIVGAADFGTVLTGGMYLGYDDSGCREHAITVKGIHFEGKGLTVAGQKNVVIEGNKFTDITEKFALHVIGKDVNAEVLGNEIDGAASVGIEVRNAVSATIEGNTVTNTGHNSVQVTAMSENGTATIKNNKLSNWGLDDEGRAIRTAGGANTVVITGNAMTNANAPEEFVKTTDATSVNVSANYWGGNDPTVASIFNTNVNVYSAVESYYTDSEMTTLVEVQAPVEINGVGYRNLNEALTAANAMTGDVTVEIYEKVEYTSSTPALNGAYDSITFVGKTDTAEICSTLSGNGAYISGKSGVVVNFKDLILSKDNSSWYPNAAHMGYFFTVYAVKAVNYTGCTFPDGACAAGCETTYTDCTFDKNTHGGKYGLWVYGNTDCTVIDSEFTGARGIKLYAEGAAKNSDLTVIDTTFENCTEKPAIVLEYAQSITLEGNTYSETGVLELGVGSDAAPDGTKITADITDISCKSDDYADCGVIVDGKIYTTVTSASEAGAITHASTVTLMYDSSAEAVEVPRGTEIVDNGYDHSITEAEAAGWISPAYTSTGSVWGEASANATDSFVIEIYSGNTLLGTKSLNKMTDAFVEGKIYVTWTFYLGVEDVGYYWTTDWIVDPTLSLMPTHVVLVADGNAVATSNVQLNAPDNLNTIYAAVADENGVIKSFATSLVDAIEAAEDGDTVALLRDVKATEVILIGKSVTIEGNGKTITSSANRIFLLTASNTTVTMNNLNMVSTAVRVGTADIRGVAVNVETTGIKLTLNNCSVDFTDASASDWSYGVNVASKTNGHTIIVNGGSYEGANVINVWGDGHTVAIDGAVLTSLYAPNEYYYGCGVRYNGNAVDDNGILNLDVKNTTFNGEHAVAVEGLDDYAAENNVDNTKTYKAIVNGVYFYTIAEAIEAANDGDTVKLIGNVDASEIITINKAITLDGNGKTITSTATRAINIDTTATVTVKNLTIVGSTGCERGINVINNAATVNLDNVKIYGQSHYAVHVATSAGAVNMTITNSDLTGYGAVVVYGAGSVVNVVDSALTGINPYADNGSNSFATIIAGAENVSITVTGGTVTTTATEGKDSMYVAGFQADASMTLDTEIKGNASAIVSGYEEGRTILVRGEYADELMAEGYLVATNNDGFVGVTGVAGANAGGVTYKTFAEALANAKAGDTLQLLEDTTSDFIIVPNDVTLDLNGYKLTAKYVAVFGCIIDSSKMEGLLVVDPDNLLIQESAGHTHTYIPVYTEGEGYRFAQLDMQIRATEVSDDVTSLSFKFRPKFAGLSVHEEYFANGAADNHLSFEVRMTWTGSDGMAYSEEMMIDEELIKSIYTNDKMIEFTLTGISTSITNLTVSVAVVSDAGVTVYDVAYTNAVNA